MSCRLMTKLEQVEFYRFLGMSGQCVVIDGEEIKITSRTIPPPAAPEKEKGKDES